MKFGLVGQSYQMRSLPFDAQRCINLFAISDKTGVEVASLFGTPGLKPFATCGAGPVRAIITCSNDRTFVVSAGILFELTSSGVATSRGSIISSTGTVTMADNGQQLAVCDGTYLYILKYSDNSFAQVTDPDLPLVKSVVFVDGYFVVIKNSSGSFYISKLYDGTVWDALDFATAESSPDNLQAVTVLSGQLVLVGTSTTEIWRNIGDATFPFARISGATPFGTTAPNTLIAIDQTIIWIGNNSQGNGVVYRMQGFSATKISTEAIDILIRKEPDLGQLTAWSYQMDGHVFYVLTGGTLETSLVFDLTTNLWHERAALSGTGTFEPHYGICAANGFGKVLVGSRVGGAVYELDIETYTDDGNPIVRKRVYTHFFNENKRIRAGSLNVNFETGVGTSSGLGLDPIASLRVSHDGARTWGNFYQKNLGRTGKYTTEVEWRRLGIAQITTFELTISSPVKISISGSYINQ